MSKGKLCIWVSGVMLFDTFNINYFDKSPDKNTLQYSTVQPKLHLTRIRGRMYSLPLDIYPFT